MGGKGAKIDLKMEEIKKDLMSIAHLIEQYFHQNINAVPIKNAAFETIKLGGKKYWTYSIQNLIFQNLDIGKKTLPNKVIDPTITLMIEVAGGYPKDYTDIIDPFTRLSLNGRMIDYSVQFILNAQSMDSQSVDIKNAWHLDRHYDDKANNEAAFFHPLYHLHQGGKELTNEDPNEFTTGNLVILEAPRLVHPPMDGIMAIDFVIRNFYEVNNHKSLTELETYKKLLQKAHNRFLRPYILSLASNWVNFSDANYDISLKYDVILPNLQK